MKRLLLVAALLAPAAWAGDRDFDALVRGVESSFGIRRTHIPMLGAMTFAKQLDLAVFEEAKCVPPDAERFDQIMRTATGGRWTPLIRTRSRGKESIYIYVRPEGDDVKMIVATFEPDEVVIVHLKVSPEELLASLNDPEHAGERLGGDKEE